jgi:hypothetical protein
VTKKLPLQNCQKLEKEGAIACHFCQSCELPPAYAGGFLRVYWNVQTCLSQITNKLFVSSPSTRHSVIETDESSNNHNYNNPDFYLFFTRLRVRNPVNWCNILSSINHIKVSIKGYDGFHPPAFAGGLLACSVKEHPKTNYVIEQSKYDNDPFWYVYRITSRSARIVREFKVRDVAEQWIKQVIWRG